MAALLLLLCAVATNGAEPEPGAAARRPASAAPRLQPSWVWSWDTLPVWGCGQGAADFTSADVALLTRYPLMWTQGERYLGGGKWIAENKTGCTNYENATATDARKIHAVRKDEPVMGYTGFMGSCSGYDNWWWSDFNSSKNEDLWLHDGHGAVCYSDTDHPPMPGGHSPGRGPLYDLCSPKMLDYYKNVILASTIESPDVAGMFFDEVSHASLLRYSSMFFGCRLSPAEQKRTEQCWIDAMVNITEWMAGHGMSM